MGEGLPTGTRMTQRQVESPKALPNVGDDSWKLQPWSSLNYLQATQQPGMSFLQASWPESVPAAVVCYSNLRPSLISCKCRLLETCEVCVLPESQGPPLPSWKECFNSEKTAGEG